MPVLEYFKRGFLLLIFSGLSLGARADANFTPAQWQTVPPAATHPIDFKTEIAPIFESSCVRCHGRGRDRGGLQIDSRETLLKGGDTGPAAIPGHGSNSYLVALVSGLDPDQIMPKKGTKLTAAQIGLLRAWIDQGMMWDAGVQFGPVATLNLDPHEPAIPAGKGEINPIDRFMDVYNQKHQLRAGRPVSDRIFARRVYLDSIGLLPAREELDQFIHSHDSGKRDRLIKTLLARNDSYAEHWMSFWNDLLRNDYKGTGYIDGGRKQITRWLYSALATNMPYDQFVAALVAPKTDSAGFTDGIVWRGVVNASQQPQMQAAQNVSQVFVGVNLKCASCHDSFINDWQLADSYGLANVYSDAPLEIFECDKPTGKKAGVKFLFPELGTLAPTTNRTARLQELAGLITCPKDGRLSRTVVNRLWAKLMGRGLVEPVDDMQQTAWNQDLLDWLAQDLVAHHYDIRATLARIMTSRTYQLAAVDGGEDQNQTYVFRGPTVRRLSAEEFRDALTTLTGVGYAEADADLGDRDKNKKRFNPRLKAQWVWNDAHAADKAKAGSIYLRTTLRLTQNPSDAAAMVACDNGFELYVNGHKAGEGHDYAKPSMIELGPWLKKGSNLIAVRAVNNLPDNTEATPATAVPGTENPAGFFFYGRIRATNGVKETVMDFGSGAAWKISDQVASGWEQPQFDDHTWTNAVELGPVSIAPWRLPGTYISSRFAERYAATHNGEVRAALVAADPLLTALGRPNREQVVTTRPSTATTLQALELTNGKTLAEILHRGAQHLVKQKENPSDLARGLFAQAVDRPPTRAELRLAKGLLGKKPGPPEVEDFLWAMVMLPEFQLIY